MNIDSPNHISWPTSSRTAFVAFEAGHSHNQQFGPTIECHSRRSGTHLSSSHGMILGPAPGPYCALIKVSAHDVVSLTCGKDGHTRRRFYFVRPDLQIVPLDPEEAADRIRAIPSQGRMPGDDFEIHDEDLENLFSSDWPEWMRPILESQLLHWKKHHVENYFRHNPFPLDETELWFCVKGAAFQALTRFRSRLNPTQVRVCLKRSRKGATLFCPDRFRQLDRERNLMQFAEDALRYGAGWLTDDELSRCARQKPDVVLRHCGDIGGRPFIIALTAALAALKGEAFGPARKSRICRQKLLESLIEHPAEWHARIAGGLSNVFHLWTDRLGIHPTADDLEQIRRRMDPGHRELVLLGVASSI